MKLVTNIHQASGNCCNARFARSEVEGQGHDQIECYNGGGMHLDAVASRLTVLIFRLFMCAVFIRLKLSLTLTLPILQASIRTSGYAH